MSDIPDNGSFNLGLANIASQNYGPTATANQAQTGANTQNLQQSAIAQAQQNKILAARMPLILSRLNDETTGSANSSGVGGDADSQGSPVAGKNGQGDAAVGPRTPGEDIASQESSATGPAQNFYQPDKIDAALRAKYFIPPFTPKEAKDYSASFAADPKDEYGVGPKSVMARRDLRIQQATAQNQLDSRDDFDKLHAVTDAPDGNAMGVLEASHPETVAAIRRQFAKDPDAAMDEDDAARMFAAHTAGQVHQYTGRKAVKGDDGVYRDEETGITIPGVEKVGLSTDQYLKFAHEAIAPTDVPDGNGGTIQVPMWKKAQMAGAKNINGPGDWIMVRASQSSLPGAASTLSPNSAPKQEARTVAQSALTKAQAAQSSQPPATNGAPSPVNGVGTARNAQGNVDPQLTTALQDTKYKYAPSNNGVPYAPQIGHTPPPPVMEDMKNQTAARNQLAKDTNAGVGAASAALTMYKAAQDVIAKGNYDGGAWNEELAKYSKWLPAGWQSHMTGDYQEIAKYLANAALQSGKGVFAKMTQQESQMLVKQLNPAPGMTPEAMSDMIAKGSKVAQYSLDSAKRVPAYLRSGNDANQFNSWNQEHYPQETETQPNPAKPNAGVTPQKYNDAQVSAYMQKYGLKDEQATRKMLGIK
jgi:hypothetical protein